MKFFCPRCSHTIATDAGQDQPHDASHATCPGCGFVVDLAMADTAAGAPVLPVVRDRSGEALGDFALGECLGSGGMGTVYRATDTRSDDTVAVKLLFPQFAAQPDLLERFHREAAALAGLSHPNIVGYRDEGSADGQHYLVMEYVEGQSLEAMLKERKPAPDEALSIALQICAALGAAHAQGIVHRDLKPANVILREGSVKVLDFGIAHVTAHDMTLTRSDAVLGTLNYMAPEQRVAAKQIDHRADLFSLGVILYRMLTGELPIGSFEPASTLNGEVDARYDRVIARVLHNNPDKRYPDVTSFAAELVQLGRPRGAWRVAVAAAAAVVLLAGAGVAWALIPADPSEPVTAVVEPPVQQSVEPPPERAQGEDILPAAIKAPAAALRPEPPPVDEIQNARPVQSKVVTKKPRSKPKSKPKRRVTKVPTGKKESQGVSAKRSKGKALSFTEDDEEQPPLIYGEGDEVGEETTSSSISDAPQSQQVIPPPPKTKKRVKGAKGSTGSSTLPGKD